MRRANAWKYVLAAGLVGGMLACGGSSSPPTSSTPPTTQPPTPPPPSVVSQGQGFPLPAGYVGRVTFTTTRTGRLDATVDWTYATNDVDLLMTRGDCSFDQLEASQCPILAFSISATAKPEKAGADGAAAGTYTLFVENTGQSDESVSYQVVLTPSATGSTGSVEASSVAGSSFRLKTPPRGVVEMR